MTRKSATDRSNEDSQRIKKGGLRRYVEALQQRQSDARLEDPVRREAIDPVDTSRRGLATGLISGLGLLAVASCVQGPDVPDESVTTSELNGTTFNWVDTMANLRALTAHSPSSPIVVLQGYNAPLDGGGGLFCWDAASTAPHNAGTIVRPNNITSDSLPGRWRRIYSGAINARWFGAGLGAADDQPALQLAIGLLASQGGGTLYLPGGAYLISTALTINNTAIEIVGDGEYATAIKKAGIDSTVFILRAAHFFHLSNLSLRMQSGSPSVGSAILFYEDSTGVLIERVSIESMWQGISCGGIVSISSTPREVVIRDVKMTGILHVGLKMFHSLNWRVSTCVIGMVFDEAWNGPGSGHYGVWLDTNSEGCIFDSIFVLGGEHCWRMANTIDTGVRGPNDHRFYSCIADNGTVSCFYISYLHRSIFTACWASTQHAPSDAAVVMDSLNVWGVQWDASEIMNVNGHAIRISAATSVTISSSIFSEWGLRTSLWAAGIYVVANPSTNFVITGNTFMRDTDFFPGTPPPGGAAVPVVVNAGTYNRYIVANNISYGCTPSVGRGALSTASIDSGTPNFGKVWSNNLI